MINDEPKYGTSYCAIDIPFVSLCEHYIKKQSSLFMEERREDGLSAPMKYTWLICFEKDKKQTLFAISYPNPHFVLSLHSESTIWCHSYGCLVYSCNHQFFVMDTITLESIVLPELYVEDFDVDELYELDEPYDLDQRHSCILSSPPSNTESTLYIFDSSRLFVYLCKLRDGEWIALNFHEEFDVDELEEMDAEPNILFRPVFCNGNLYAVTQFGDLVLVDLVNVKLVYLDITVPDHYIHYLVESCGELFAINIHYGGIAHYDVTAVEVYRLDFSQMSWTKAERFKDRALFVGYNCCFCYAAIDSKFEGNHVYFVSPDRKSLCSFNGEDGSVSFPLPCFDSSAKEEALETVSAMMGTRLNGLKEKGIHVINTQEQEEDEKDCEVKENENGVGVFKKKNHTEQEQQLLDIPPEIIGVIVRHLTLVDYMHFRAVCRMTRSIAPPNQWSINAINRHSVSPWLMCIRKDGFCSFIDPQYGDKYFINLPDSLSEYSILYSKDGWLLMSKSPNRVLFCNPFSKEIIQRPNDDSSFIGFTASPTSSDSVVYKFESRRAGFCHPGKWEWEGVGFENEYNFYLSSTPLFYKGAYYCLDRKGYLGILEKQEDGLFYWETFDELELPCESFHQIFLVGCNGDVLQVFVGHARSWVRVFKLNRAKRAWECIESLGKHTLYLSRSYSFSRIVKTPELENKIIFPIFCGQSIVFYSLDTKSFHSFGSKNTMVNFYSTREYLQCCWIEPRWI